MLFCCFVLSSDKRPLPYRPKLLKASNKRQMVENRIASSFFEHYSHFRTNPKFGISLLAFSPHIGPIWFVYFALNFAFLGEHFNTDLYLEHFWFCVKCIICTFMWIYSSFLLLCCQCANIIDHPTASYWLLVWALYFGCDYFFIAISLCFAYFYF